MRAKSRSRAYVKFLLHLLLLICPTAQAKDPFIEQMVSTYKANEARFHLNYRGKTINSEGTVTKVKTDPLGTGSQFYVYIDVNGSKVNCDTRDQKEAASLDVGGKVKFSGRIHDVAFGALDVKSCRFNTQSNRSGISTPTNLTTLESASKKCASENGEIAIAACTEAIRLNPNNADAYATRGCLFAKEGNSMAALLDLGNAHSLDPNTVKGNIQEFCMKWNSRRSQ